MGAAAAALAVTTAVSACGGEVTQSQPSSTSATTTSNPSERTYTDVYSLASDLSAHGIECDTEADTTYEVRAKIVGEHNAAKCDLPVAGDPAGVPITLSVWPSAMAAQIGTSAWARFLKSARGDGPQVYYFVTGSNWMIDFGMQRKAPEQVIGSFGGKLMIVD